MRQIEDFIALKNVFVLVGGLAHLIFNLRCKILRNSETQNNKLLNINRKRIIS